MQADTSWARRINGTIKVQPLGVPQTGPREFLEQFTSRLRFVWEPPSQISRLPTWFKLALDCYVKSDGTRRFSLVELAGSDPAATDLGLPEVSTARGSFISCVSWWVCVDAKLNAPQNLFVTALVRQLKSASPCTVGRRPVLFFGGRDLQRRLSLGRVCRRRPQPRSRASTARLCIIREEPHVTNFSCALGVCLTALICLGSVSVATAANRTWVGGNNNWDAPRRTGLAATSWTLTT